MSHTPWGQLEDLLRAASRRKSSERADYVARECGDPALRAALTALLTNPDASTPAAAPIAAAEPDDRAWSAGRIGPYVLLDRLGRGGMGEVFLARDTRLDRLVALKCLVSSTATPEELRGSIVREARLAARINHPHVAAVHDVIDDDGRTVMVMEHVAGETLAARLKTGPLRSATVVEFGRQMADALDAAHRAGVIHRDLKPGNILIARDGAIKILDFGIATAYAALASATTRTDAVATTLTAAPQCAGTRGYMSPEQILGRTVDERSDIFSLSLVLFEMVTGKSPFQSTDPFDVLVATVRGLPRAEATDGSTPPLLADAIARGLSADPSERFQSAAELSRALASISEPPIVPASRMRWLTVVGLLSMLPLVVWMLGRLSSAAYNTTLDRTGLFAQERWIEHLTWGTRSVVAPVVYAVLTLAAIWAVRFVLRIVALWRPAGTVLTVVKKRTNALLNRLSLRDPAVLAQALTGLGLVALVLFAWHFSHLISAWGTRVSADEGATLAPLVPDNETERALYRAVLTALFVVFSIGLFRVLQLRARVQAREGLGPVLALGGLVASLLLLIEIPYRTFQSKAPVAEFRQMRCYAIGEDQSRYLLYCPLSPPPRNRIVDKTDPALRLTGEIESIFTVPAR